MNEAINESSESPFRFKRSNSLAYPSLRPALPVDRRRHWFG